MTLKPVFAALFTAGLLSGCATVQTGGQTAPSLVPISGQTVPAGVPCDHLVKGAPSRVIGCEGYIPLSPLSSEQAAEIASLNTRFASEVPPVVNFDFDRAELRADARKIIDAQAAWMRRYTQVRFSVYGHTDLVGSEGYNFDLAKRRAEAVVAELAARGVNQDQLDALVSYGESKPLVETPKREELNRRTVTEVTGYLTSPRLRATVPVSCAWIAPAYLASYPVCVKEPSVLVPPPPPPPPPPPVTIETRADAGTGTDSTGTAASITSDGNTVTKETNGYAGGGAVTSYVKTVTTPTSYTVTVPWSDGTLKTFSGDQNGQNMKEVKQ